MAAAASASATDEGDTSEAIWSLLPAVFLRTELCADARLSKRAAVLLRNQCDGFATDLVTRALHARSSQGGPLTSDDLWEALLSDPQHEWLGDRLGLWTTPQSLPDGVKPPQPPPDCDSTEQPPLVWRRARVAEVQPMHELLLEPAPSGAPLPLHPSMLE